MEWTPWYIVAEGLLAVAFVLYVVALYRNRHDHPMKLGGLLTLVGLALMIVGNFPIAPPASAPIWTVGCVLLAFGALIDGRQYRNERT